MQTASEWKRHFARRFKSLDGHIIRASSFGSGPGTIQSLVGFLAEVCPPRSLELVETIVRNTVMTISDRAIPGRAASAPRERPTDNVAVRATVERANTWLTNVQNGRTAGESVRLVADDEAGSMMTAGTLVAGGLILLAPPEAVEGLKLALRPIPMETIFRSEKVNELAFVLDLVMNDARALAPLFRDL
ncbi:hypothetical protein [Microbacterium sp. NPDC079208]|uniref:hypothetical protein n=1 Tax=Microbacterium sp. NPDC079208 TaxID=3154652 RepID=UPI00344D7E3E